MALNEKERNPAFRSDIRASGLGEVWTHTHDQLKFTQFGWRSTTKESSYSNNTLIGNWNEERFALKHVYADKPLPSQFNSYFETTATASFPSKKSDASIASERLDLQSRSGKEPISFPGHQPELDHPLDKEMYNSFMTTSRLGYVHPEVRRATRQ